MPQPVRCLYAEPSEPVEHVDLPVWALPKGENGEPVFEDAVWTAPADEAARFQLQKHTYWYNADGWHWSFG